MQTTTINAAPLTLPASKPTTRTFADLNSDDFFGLLIAQLRSQDPLKPTDNQQLLQQMSSIRQMEQSSTLNKTLNALAGEQRFGATAGLIGRYVVGTVKNSAGVDLEVAGVVTAVQFDKSGQAVLELHNGNRIPAGSVEQVTMVENLPPELRAQLETELAAGPRGTSASAKLKSSPAPQQDSGLKASDVAQDLSRRTEEAGALLDAVLSPGVGVGL